MRIKFLLFVALMLLMTTNACSPITAITDSGAQPARTFQVAFIGSDGNVWFTSGLGLEPRQITTDAFRSEDNDPPGAGIAYYFPRISGDGEWVAYRRDVTGTGGAGLQYSSGLFLHNSKTGKSLPVLDEMPAVLHGSRGLIFWLTVWLSPKAILEGVKIRSKSPWHAV
jgi:hypothetical protein